ncbi:MAG: hypothetical protein ACI9VR_001699 [Cognaticolwellia sp.]|jgi:hypothetical protein
MMLLFILACTAFPPWAEARDQDADTQDSALASFPSLGLDSQAHWESEESGVATGLAWGDMDLDGDPDLVVSYGNDITRGPIAVYTNQDGQLAESAAFTTTLMHFYGHLEVADLNGDGWLDVVASRLLGDQGFEQPGGVEVYISDQGTLPGLPTWQAEGFYTFSPALGDWDLDGDLDLAVATGEPYYNPAQANLVYENDGEGDFGKTPAWSSPPDHSLDAAWVDLDQDGDLDLVFARIGEPHCAFLNGPDGLSSTPSWQAEGDPTRHEGNTLDFADVNQDGAMDLVISDNLQLGGAGTVSLYCGPTLNRCWESADSPQYQSAVRIEDVDGDGLVDLVAGSWGQEGGLGAPVRIYTGQADGLWSDVPQWFSESSSVIEALSFEDIDSSDSNYVFIEGEGLVTLPHGRIVNVEGGAAHRGYLSGTGTLRATVSLPADRDLAVSNWDKDIGNQLYGRTAP